MKRSMRVFHPILFLCTVSIFTTVLGFTLKENKLEIEDRKDKLMHPKNIHVPGKAVSKLNVESEQFWFDSAQSSLTSKLKLKNIERQAKNIIFFLGDGLSVATITAARIFKGQLENMDFGEEAELYFNTFPHIGVSKTFCSNAQVADSACTSTSYLCGTKGNAKTIGVSPDVKLEDCVAQMKPENQVSSILAWAQAAGKSTGVVTTTRVTDGSPAGTYAHVAYREWHTDADVTASGVDPDICDDVSEQMIERDPGRKINVIFGGGRLEFFDQSIPDVETGEAGKRKDGKDLVSVWKEDKKNEKAKYITGRDELLTVNTSDVDYVLGLFGPSDLDYLDTQTEKNDPSIVEMTKVAIEILEKNPLGFFLFVEGGRIDHAHHDNNAKRALYETIEFDKAIKLAGDMTSEEDTISVVTADHSHVMTISGYQTRGNPILGIANSELGSDDLPYATLSYANGPGYKAGYENGTRYNIINDDFEDINYLQLSAAPRTTDSHGGDDVLIFSKGPFAHLLTGVQQQSFIPHALGYAACIGPFVKFCDSESNILYH